jgi:hypothetical protein
MTLPTLLLTFILFFNFDFDRSRSMLGATRFYSWQFARPTTLFSPLQYTKLTCATNKMSQELDKKWQRHEEEEDNLEEEEEEPCIKLDLVVPTTSSPDSELLLVDDFGPANSSINTIRSFLWQCQGPLGSLVGWIRPFSSDSCNTTRRMDPSPQTQQVGHWWKKPISIICGLSERDSERHCRTYCRGMEESVVIVFYRAKDYHQDYYLWTSQARFIR